MKAEDMIMWLEQIENGSHCRCHLTTCDKAAIWLLHFEGKIVAICDKHLMDGWVKCLENIRKVYGQGE